MIEKYLLYMDLCKCTGIQLTSCHLLNSDMYTLVVERKYDSRKRFFGLCESCYWTATILKETKKLQCPACLGDNVSLIPLSNNEKYEYSFGRKQGLQIKFSLLNKEARR